MAPFNQAVHEGEQWVGRVLVEWIDPAVPNRNARQIYPRVRVLEEMVGDGRDVVAGKALTSEEEFAALIAWVPLHEFDQELFEVSGYLALRVAVAENCLGERKASAYWLVDVHDICILVPAVLVVNHLSLCLFRRRVLPPVRSIFRKHRKH